MKSLRLLSACRLILLGALLGIQNFLMAQPCALTFNPNPGPGTVTIVSPFAETLNFTPSKNPAVFIDTVTKGNSTVPAGTYLGWCIDTTDNIDFGPEAYNVLMYSSCDPNIDAELTALGLTYHYSYPTTDTQGTSAEWNAVNYIINNPVSGATFWDIQAAIWSFIGGPNPSDAFWKALGYPQYSSNNVNAMVLNAQNNPNWQPQCGNVIAVILAITSKDKSGDFPVQLSILQAPFPCPLNCYTNITDAENAALAESNGTNCSGLVNLTVTNNGETCPATITVRGTNACNNTNFIGIFTATILTNLPTFSGLPPKTTNYECYADVPAAPNVTAMDACGTPLAVNGPNQSETHTGSSCYDVITRTWTTEDCAGQFASFTETITVQETNPPTLNQGSHLGCYSSLAAASNAAVAATSGTANCGGPITNFSASVNGLCPATIIVTGTDNCGLSAIATYTATIFTALPVLYNVPANTNYQCLSDVPPEPTVTASNSCLVALTVNVTDVTNASQTSLCSYTITRTWSATDCAQQTTSQSQTIAVQNTTLPGLTVTPGGPLACNATPPSVATVSNGVVATASCGGTVTYTVTPADSVTGCLAQRVFTVIATDSCGNTATQYVTYTWTANTTPPGLTVPPGGSLACNATPPSITTVSNGVVVTASCGSTVTYTVTSADSLTGCLAQRVFTIIATDSCSNTTTKYVTYTWTANTTPPGLTVPPGGSLTCNATPPSIATVSNGVIATASCGSTVTYTVTSADSLTGCLAQRVFTIIATDSCANTATQYVTYTWTANTTPPGLTVPPGGSLACNATPPSITTVSNGVVATASCGSTVTYTVTSADSLTGCLAQRVFTVIATDSCGNMATQYVTYTWTANTTPPGLTVAPGGSLACNATPPSITTVSNGVVVTASCGSTVGYTVTCADSVTGCTKQRVFTVIATDSCSNTTTKYVTYTWTANTTPPGLTVPPGGPLACNATPPSITTVSNGVVATASCGSTVTFTVTCADSLTGCTKQRVFTVIATDSCSNTTTKYVTYTWTVNTTPPGLTVPAGGSLACNATPPSITTISNGVVVTASCGSTVSYTVTCADSVTGCTKQRVFTVIATDSCANTTTKYVTYTWTILTSLPTLHGVPVNTTVPCASQIPAWPTVTATNSCGAPLTVVTNQTQSNPGSTCSNVITRTWSATDCAGQNVSASQVITQYDNVVATLSCPTNVTIFTNICQMYCTFNAGDWSGACNGGYRYNYNWWQNYCGQNSPSQSWPSWTNWWSSCSATTSQCNNWWNNWNNSRPTTCWGSWSGNGNNWFNSWNSGNQGNQQWVPCNGSNPDTILNNCFKQVYANGCVTLGLPNGGKCVTLTSCSAVQTCLGISGNPGVLSGSCNNPSSCSAGSFCAQVLALKLNCDFGDYGCVPGFVGKCGDLVLCQSSSPCNGKRVRDILNICNTALGGGSCPQGCTAQYLTTLCSNLNQCFEGCQVSSWCKSNLCTVYIPSPAVTGTATVSDNCGGAVTLTNIDTVSTGSCNGTYIINREWIAVDACGNSNYCTQLITVVQKCQTRQVCGSFNSQNPGSGYVWCNAHLSCNPGKACNIYCQNASVTLTCNDGKTYTFPVPDCQVTFSPKCSSGSCQFDGSKWTTTLPCSGDDEIFLSGCGIPWQADFANCHSVCWTGSFTCDTAGVNCNWQWSGACYKSDLSNCGSVNVKPCHSTPCGYSNGDHAGTPENCKSSCQGGACGTGGNNYCGSWSSSDSFSCN